jgi:hypothetical protein
MMANYGSGPPGICFEIFRRSQEVVGAWVEEEEEEAGRRLLVGGWWRRRRRRPT